MSDGEACDICTGSGLRLVAALSDPHYAIDASGKPKMAHSYTIPIVAPCRCAADRAARAPSR